MVFSTHTSTPRLIYATIFFLMYELYCGLCEKYFSLKLKPYEQVGNRVLTRIPKVNIITKKRTKIRCPDCGNTALDDKQKEKLF